MQLLPHPVLRLWRIAGLAIAAALWISSSIADYGARSSNELPFPVLIGPAAVGIVAAAAGFIYASARYRSWRFELTDQHIEARWGVVTHNTAIIARNRVQTVTSQNGPFDRLLGLTSVKIHTAGLMTPDIQIPHLEDKTVEWLKTELTGTQPSVDEQPSVDK